MIRRLNKPAIVSADRSRSKRSNSSSYRSPMNVIHQSSGGGVSNTYPSGVAISAGPSRGSRQRTRTSATSAVPGYVSPPRSSAIPLRMTLWAPPAPTAYCV